MQQDMNQLIKQVEALVYYSQIHPVKGVQPVNMPDHESAWRKAQQWLWDNCEADEMGNYHLKGQPGGQSAGTWVKASERTPDNDDVLHVKIDGIRYMGNFFDAEKAGEKGFYVQSNGAHEGWIIEQHKFSGILWLDEGTLPDNKDYVQDLKELDAAFEYLYKHEGVKDAGNGWIAFSDKWNSFKRKLNNKP